MIGGQPQKSDREILDEIEADFERTCEKMSKQQLDTLVENSKKMTKVESDLLRKLRIVTRIRKDKFGV